MPSAAGLGRHQERKQALGQLGQLFANRYLLRVVHYSCESFRDRDDTRSPRITSIAVLNCGTGLSASFSIHQVAERAHALPEIESRYDEFEKQMLSEFYVHVKAQPEAVKWLHWNMRDATYGFAAIAHRSRVLEIEPLEIRADACVNIAGLLKDIYGYRYIGHPRLTNIVELNEVGSASSTVSRRLMRSKRSSTYVYTRPP